MELLTKYDRLVIFDTETTGLQFARDEIIEFSAAVVESVDGRPAVTQTYDELIRLSPGNTVPPFIANLTHITDEMLCSSGIEKSRAARDIASLFDGNTLLCAYNAHFDLSFLYYFLLREHQADVLRGKDKLDLLTIYKDRKPYPHKLCNAIDAYGLTGKVQNSHRAIDDVLSTVAVMEAMAAEKDDFLRYVNLFGYNAKYGIGSKPIGSVTYKPQSYGPAAPLYETEVQL